MKKLLLNSYFSPPFNLIFLGAVLCYSLASSAKNHDTEKRYGWVKKDVTISNCTGTYRIIQRDQRCKNLGTAKPGDTIEVLGTYGLEEGDTVTVHDNKNQPFEITPDKPGIYHKVKFYNDNLDKTVIGFLPEKNITDEEVISVQPLGQSIHFADLTIEPKAKPQSSKDCCSQHLGFLRQLGVLNELNQANAYLEAGLKSESEIDDYLKRYRKLKGRSCKSSYFDDYMKEYKVYIKAAAEAFQLPFGFLACLLFKESQFDKDAFSVQTITATKPTRDAISGKMKNKGQKVRVPLAKGIGQFREDTQSDINDLLIGVQRDSDDKIKEYEDGFFNEDNRNFYYKNREKCSLFDNRLEKYYASKKTIWAGTRLTDKNRESTQTTISEDNQFCQRVRDYEYYNSKLKNHRVGKPWFEYFNRLNDSEVFQSSPSGRVPNPSRFTQVGITLPANSIGASALYLRYVLDDLSFEYSKKPDFKGFTPEQSKELLLAAAAGYNMGPGNLRKYARKRKDPSEIIEAIKSKKSKNEQTKSYVKSIENCMTKGVDTGPIGMDGKEHNSTCAPPGAKK